MNKLIFVVLVSILKWSYLVHGRCLLIKWYINILSVGPSEIQNVPRAHQPLEITTSIAIIPSFLAHCPHVEGPPLTPARCSWDALDVSHVQMRSLHLLPPHEHRCPTTGTFWGEAIPKCRSCPRAIPSLPDLQDTPAAERCTSPSGLSEPLMPAPCPTSFLGPWNRLTCAPHVTKSFMKTPSSLLPSASLSTCLRYRPRPWKWNKYPSSITQRSTGVSSFQEILTSPMQINSSGPSLPFDKRAKIHLNLNRRVSNPASVSHTQAPGSINEFFLCKTSPWPSFPSHLPPSSFKLLISLPPADLRSSLIGITLLIHPKSRFQNKNP